MKLAFKYRRLPRSGELPSPLPHDPRHPAHLAVGEPDLDPVGMEGGVGEDILHHPLRPFPRPLILLEDDLDLQPRLYVLSILAVHAPPMGAPPAPAATLLSSLAFALSLDLQEEELEDEGLSGHGVVRVEGDRLVRHLGHREL